MSFGKKISIHWLKSKVKACSPIFVLFVVQQIIYTRLSFTPLSKDYRMVGDLIVFHYPVNMFNSDAFRAGIVPLWNPYVHSGFPWVTGLEYKVFYPIQIFVSLMFGYSYEVMQVEFMLTILFGGIGFFFLLKEFNLVRVACYFGAISFFSSGIFIGNSQHFGQVIVYAFTPWILLQLFKLYKTNEQINAVYGAILLAFLVTGGYAGTYIVLAYIMVLLSLIMIGFAKRRLRLFLNLLIMGGLAVGLSTIHLLPCLTGFSQTSRAAGLSYEMAVIEHSLAATDLFSSILPKSATSQAFAHGPESSQSETMRNFHLGALLPCLLVIALVFCRERRLIWLVFALSLFLLLEAMGDATIFRPITYEYFPAMNNLRLNSAIFRGFTIIGFCFIASFGLNCLVVRKEFFVKYWMIVFYPVVILLFVEFAEISNEKKAVLYEDLPIFFAIICVFVGIFALFKKNFIKDRLFSVLMIILIMLEFSYAVKNNSNTLWIYDPVFRRDVKVLEFKRDVKFEHLGEYNEIYQYPDEYFVNYIPLVRHVPSDYGPSSTMLEYYEEYLHTHAYSDAKSNNIERKLINFPETVTYYDNETDVVNHLDTFGIYSNIYAAGTKDQNPDMQQLNIINFDGTASLAGIEKYTLNSLEFTYKSDSGRLALLNQAYFPGWTAYVKETGESISISKINHAFSGLSLPSGSGTVILEFTPLSYRIGKWISLFFVFLTIIVLFVEIKKKKRSGDKSIFEDADHLDHRC